MPRILFLVIFATLMTALPALAENWVLVTRDDKGTDYYIDTESVQGSNNTYLFWRMAVRAKPNEAGIVAEKTFVSMSCPLRAWRRKAVASFNAQAELVNREEFDANEPLQFFMDGTVGERLWKFVCK